jgi:hypothetical protein
MQINRYKWVAIVLLISSFSIACSTRKQVNQFFSGYQYSSPTESACRGFIENTKSVYRLSTYVTYQTWYYLPGSIPLSAKGEALFTDEVVNRKQSSESYMGTATVIYTEGRKFLLVTAGHVLDFQDTIIRYYEKEGERTGIYSVSVKQEQVNYLRDVPGGGAVRIIDIDRKEDIAICYGWVGEGISIPEELDQGWGKVADIQSGNAIMLAGYPLGYRNYSRATISLYGVDANKGFLIDAGFNRGYSGGLVSAWSLEDERWHWVGIITAAPSTSDFMVVPAGQFGVTRYMPDQPYNGPLFISAQTQLAYGLTFVAPINYIRDLINRNEKRIRELGFSFDNLDNR